MARDAMDAAANRAAVGAARILRATTAHRPTARGWVDLMDHRPTARLSAAPAVIPHTARSSPDAAAGASIPSIVDGASTVAAAATAGPPSLMEEAIMAIITTRAGADVLITITGMRVVDTVRIM